VGTTTYAPTVHITSRTGAEIHVDGDVDELFASTEEGLRARVIEAIRQLAASAGEPVTATVVDGASRWPMIVHPDGTFLEAPALSGSDAPEADAAGSDDVPPAPVFAPVAAAEPADAVPSKPQAAAAPEPAAASVQASVTQAPVAPAAAPAPAAAGPLRSDSTRRPGSRCRSIFALPSARRIVRPANAAASSRRMTMEGPSGIGVQASDSAGAIGNACGAGA